MKTRFRKVWCSSCSTMQFAGECGHVTNVVGPAPKFAAILSQAERRAPLFASKALAFSRGAFKDMPDDLLEKMVLRRLGDAALILPEPVTWKQYKADAGSVDGRFSETFIVHPSGLREYPDGTLRGSAVNWKALEEALK